jgi:hypothetical protein
MNRGLFERWKPLRADLLLERETFPRQADVQPEECVREDDGALFVFVSHRWETLAHPDPDHRQFRSVHFLLRCLLDLLCVVDSTLRDEANALRDVRRHGYPQALVLLFRLLASARSAAEPRELLKKVGVWYDYSCMPQGRETAAARRALAEALLGLPGLLERSDISLVALRERGDDFEHRAWCVLETILSRYGEAEEPLILRIDRLDEPLLLGDDPEHAHILDAAFAEWERPRKDLDRLTASLGAVGVMFNIDSGRYFSGDDGLTTSMASFSDHKATELTAGWLTALLTSSGEPVDVGAVLTAIGRKRGLKTAREQDLPFTLLTGIRIHQTGRLREFAAECLERHVRGRSLTVRVAFDRAPNGTLQAESLRWQFVQAQK